MDYQRNHLIMAGYDPNFLGNNITLPVPSFAPSLAGDVLHSPRLENEIFAHYVNHSIITHRVRRSPIIACLTLPTNEFGGFFVLRLDGTRQDFSYHSRGRISRLRSMASGTSHSVWIFDPSSGMPYRTQGRIENIDCGVMVAVTVLSDASSESCCDFV